MNMSDESLLVHGYSLFYQYLQIDKHVSGSSSFS